MKDRERDEALNELMVDYDSLVSLLGRDQLRALLTAALEKGFELGYSRGWDEQAQATPY